jgi:hypothetical protein
LALYGEKSDHTFQSRHSFNGLPKKSAIVMWYVPYLFGTTEERKRDYSKMYAGTRQVLPARGGNHRRNLLHVCFHVLFVINFVLVLFLRLRSATDRSC